MRLTLKLLVLFIGLNTTLFAQIPPNYYDNAVGKRGTAMQLALHNIIDGHTSVGYGGVINAHTTTDAKPNGKVWDMYSDVPGGTPPYEFTFITDKCGSYQNEGDCYNREHSFPQSWFNKAEPMRSDLFHVYPTDGKVNGYRSSYPYGEVSNPTKTSLNGSKLGPNTSAGYSGTVFEPLDEYKGDLARSYFYMAVRYYTEDNGWKNNAAVNGSQMKPWELNLLYQWNLQDTVSQKEIDRNNAIYGIQHNRNPFIDHPEWIDSIWFDNTSIKKLESYFEVNLYPNPANDKVTLNFGSFIQKTYHIELYDLSGRLLQNTENKETTTTLNIEDLSKGLYIIHVYSDDRTQNKTIKLIKE